MSELHNGLERLSLGSTSGMGGGLSPASAVGSKTVTKQRSQRFTVATSSPQSKRTSLQSVPSLPYQPPPPPVQSQSLQSTAGEPYYSFNRNPPVERSHSQQSATSGSSNPYSEYSDPTQTQSPSSYPPPVPPISQHYQAPGQHQYYTSSAPPTSYSTPYAAQQGASQYPSAVGSGFRARGGDSPANGGGAGLRSGLPTEWMGRTGLPNGSYESNNIQGGYAALIGRPAPDDEVIPTAIVIKNIPFNVAKEVLLGIMEDLRLPPPFAFNYHFDNGQFRGLAFANYRQASDASLTVSALNGFDVQGRKLRTEFKKVLREGEKERIEREKAIKRMRSQRELSEPGASLGPPIGTWSRREASAPGGYGFGGGQAANEEEDYGRLVQGQFSAAFATPSGPGRGFGLGEGAFASFNAPPFGHPAPSSVVSQPPYSTSPPSDVGTSISARMAQTASSQSGSSNEGAGTSGSSGELDLNDPFALSIYSRVLLFKDDPLRDELAFARSLTPPQRRIVHMVAKKLVLGHKSVGEEEVGERVVVVFKEKESGGLSVPEVTKPLRHSTSTLGRATIPLNSYPTSTNPSSSSFLDPNPQDSPTAHASLRKKSMPDFRRGSSKPGTNFQSASLGRRSLGPGTNGHASVMGIFGDAPPLPTSQNMYQTQSDSTSSNDDGQGLAVRQPKGPSEDGGWRSRDRSPARMGTMDANINGETVATLEF